jgi:hypothetical protein
VTGLSSAMATVALVLVPVTSDVAASRVTALKNRIFYLLKNFVFYF